MLQPVSGVYLPSREGLAEVPGVRGLVRLNAVVAGSRPHSVRFYLVLLALAVAIRRRPLSFYVSARVAAAEREATEAALLNNAGSLAAAVDQEIDKHIAVATTLAHSQSLLDGDWQEFWQRAKDVVRRVAGFLAGRARSHRTDFAEHHTAAGQRSASPSIIRRRASRHCVPESPSFRHRHGIRQPPPEVVCRRSRAARRAAIISARHRAEPRAICRAAAEPKISEKLAGCDRRLQRQIRCPASRCGRNEIGPAGQRRLAECHSRDNPSGVVYHVATDGHRIIDGYTHTAYGWTVGIGIRESILKAPLRRTQWMLVAACLGCIGLGVLLAWLVARRLHRSAMQLQKAATSIASEQPLNVAPTGVREYDDAVAAIAIASQALHARAQERDRAEAALAKSADEHNALYEFTNRLSRAESLERRLPGGDRRYPAGAALQPRLGAPPDEAGAMRFVAWRGLSDRYRAAVDGHSPWADRRNKSSGPSASMTSSMPICRRQFQPSSSRKASARCRSFRWCRLTARSPASS